MNKNAVLLGFAFLSISAVSIPVWAEDSPKDACNKAATLFADDDLDSALEEAKWCVTLLEQLQQARTGQFFKDTILGYVGGQIESQNMMGFSSTQREYQKGDAFINVTLNGMASSGGMDALSALAQLGMNAGGGKKVRIQKRTAVVIDQDGQVEIMISMKKGGTLAFESNSVSAEEVQKFAEAFPVEALDDSRN